MFSPEKDLKELIIDTLKKDQLSISGVCRELTAKGVKLHRLELSGYLKALADMNVLKVKDIKPAKVFSMSSTRDRNLYELIGDISASYARTNDDRATLAAYCLQKLFRRAVFGIELRRCGIEGTVEGRKATSEERSEAKSILTRMGYKVPNSDIPTIVEKELDNLFSQVLADVVVEKFNSRAYLRQTTQTKL